MSAAGDSPTMSTGAGLLAAIPATLTSSAFSTASPSGRSAVTISDFAVAMASRLPNSPRWALPTLRTTETSGGAIVHK